MKLGYTFRNLKNKLKHVSLERDELHSRLEQHKKDKEKLLQREILLGQNKIENLGNLVVATMRNLGPPISIFQFYQVYKPMILKWSNLPYMNNKSHLNKEEF